MEIAIGYRVEWFTFFFFFFWFFLNYSNNEKKPFFGPEIQPRNVFNGIDVARVIQGPPPPASKN